jgi:hypothetical protein
VLQAEETFTHCGESLKILGQEWFIGPVGMEDVKHRRGIMKVEKAFRVFALTFIQEVEGTFQ